MSNSIALPKPKALLEKCKSLALLDAIHCQEWHLRYFSHNAHWHKGEQMASMRDGEGNDYFVWFSPCGVAIKGCFIKDGLSGHPQILQNARALIPAQFAGFMQEAAFSIDEASFFIWLDEPRQRWIKVGAAENGLQQNDGCNDLMRWLMGDALFYQNWAMEYYEKSIEMSFTQHIFQFKPISLKFIQSFAVHLDKQQLLEDIHEIGYPCQ